MTPEQSVIEMKNLGSKMAAWLGALHIHTRGDLERVGAVLAYKMLRHHRPGVTVLALYALHGALQDRHWNSLSAGEKAQLKAQASGTLHVG
ncbi:MAG: TfoX/Sxy family protein [Bacteroidota bacterium]